MSLFQTEKISMYIYKGYLFKLLSYSLNIIMWTKVWRIAYSCIKSFSVLFANFLWNDWIKDTNTIDKFKNIVTIMLSNGIINEGWLFILNTFTLDVSQAHLHVSEDVKMFKALIASQYQWYGHYISCLWRAFLNELICYLLWALLER